MKLPGTTLSCIVHESMAESCACAIEQKGVNLPGTTLSCTVHESMTESCACAIEQKGIKLPGTTLFCTEHLLNDRKLRLRNEEEENK